MLCFARWRIFVVLVKPGYGVNLMSTVSDNAKSALEPPMVDIVERPLQHCAVPSSPSPRVRMDSCSERIWVRVACRMCHRYARWVFQEIDVTNLNLPDDKSLNSFTKKLVTSQLTACFRIWLAVIIVRLSAMNRDKFAYSYPSKLNSYTNNYPHFPR